ncbi:MAG: hypothetical protein Q8O67_22495 [Deltaproteobacteria bacterium]|nr:hypothetical protein [Deltaproteobacteria bacterium]
MSFALISNWLVPTGGRTLRVSPLTKEPRHDPDHYGLVEFDLNFIDWYAALPALSSLFAVSENMVTWNSSVGPKEKAGIVRYVLSMQRILIRL